MLDETFETLELSADDGVLFVTLDSPRSGNALTETAIFELLDLAIAVNDATDVRCLALTGAGDAFCVGVDLAELNGLAADAATSRRFASVLHDALVQLHQAELPVVVGVDGVAAGAGFSLAAAGDLVVMSEAARMEFAYDGIGLTGDGGITFLLPRLVGLRRAKEIVVRERPIGSEEAVDLGLATEAVPAARARDRFEAVAHEVAAGPVAAYGATFRLMDRSFDRSFEAQLAAETDAIAAALARDEYAEGYDAFMAGRSPTFRE